jgi:hypothetical protein
LKSKKVRIWDIEKGKYLNHVVVEKSGEIYPILETNQGEKISSIEQLEQSKIMVINDYTEMSDQAKKPLYVEDIVELVVIQKNGRNQILGRGVLGVVKYIAPGYVVATKEGLYAIHPNDFFNIIGNLRETPEQFFNPSYNTITFKRNYFTECKCMKYTKKLINLDGGKFAIKEFKKKYVFVEIKKERFVLN